MVISEVARRNGLSPQQLFNWRRQARRMSAESNGMSESFVKTLKRDYARLNVLTDADAILAMLPDWIEDYGEVHPHSGLKFRSPREFIRLSA